MPANRNELYESIENSFRTNNTTKTKYRTVFLRKIVFLVQFPNNHYFSVSESEQHKETISGYDVSTFIAVEIIGSLHNIGSALGYPVGLIYERFGRLFSFGFALVLTAIPLVLLFASQYTITFYQTYWQLLGLWLFLFGMKIDCQKRFD